jgi:hypothetical protein
MRSEQHVRSAVNFDFDAQGRLSKMTGALTASESSADVSGR